MLLLRLRIWTLFNIPWRAILFESAIAAIFFSLVGIIILLAFDRVMKAGQQRHAIAATRYQVTVDRKPLVGVKLERIASPVPVNYGTPTATFTLNKAIKKIIDGID